MVEATTGAVTDQTDEPLPDLEDVPGPPGHGDVSRPPHARGIHPMPGAPREPDNRRAHPNPDAPGPVDPDDVDRRDVPMLGGAGPILAILAMTLLALLSVQLTGTR